MSRLLISEFVVAGMWLGVGWFVRSLAQERWEKKAPLRSL